MSLLKTHGLEQKCVFDVFHTFAASDKGDLWYLSVASMSTPFTINSLTIGNTPTPAALISCFCRFLSLLLRHLRLRNHVDLAIDATHDELQKRNRNGRKMECIIRICRQITPKTNYTEKTFLWFQITPPTHRRSWVPCMHVSCETSATYSQQK